MPHSHTHTLAYVQTAGTSKQVVALDYARRLQAGRDTANAALSGWISRLTGSAGNPPTTGWVACDLANATVCPLTVDNAAAGSSIALFIYNSQSAAPRPLPLRIPVLLSPARGVASWLVQAADGVTQVAAQLVPASPADAALRAYHGGAPVNASWLCFFSPLVPSVGYTLVFLSPVATRAAAPLTAASSVTRAALNNGTTPFTLSNGPMTLSFDPATGLLSGFASASPDSLASAPLSQTLQYYSSSKGDAADLQESGAYIFRPNSSSAYAVAARGGGSPPSPLSRALL